MQGQLIHEPLPKKWDLLKPLNVKITPESPARSLVSVLTTEHLKISARCMTCEGDFRGIPQNGWKVARCAWGSGFALTVAAGQANCPHLCDLSFSLDVTLTHCSRPSYNRPLTYVTGKRPQVKVVALHDLFLTTILQSVPMLVFSGGESWFQLLALASFLCHCHPTLRSVLSDAGELQDARVVLGFAACQREPL